jgi:hypothetical protein
MPNRLARQRKLMLKLPHELVPLLGHVHHVGIDLVEQIARQRLQRRTEPPPV